MKILLLIACVLFSALAVTGENQEMPAGNADESVQAELWPVTNYPAVLRYYNQEVLCLYGRKLVMLNYGKKQLELYLARINDSAEKDYAEGVINAESLGMLRTICSQIQAGGVERKRHIEKYQHVMQIDSSTDDGQRQVKREISQAQKEWNEYATAARAEIETNIRELARLLKAPPAPADP